MPGGDTSAVGSDPEIERRERGADLRALAALLLLAAAWNVVGNLVLPSAWYVPANLAAAGVVLLVGRGAGLSADELGLRRAAAPRGMTFGLVAVAVVGLALAIALVVPALDDAFDDAVVATDSTSMRWFRPLIRIPLGTVVFEELLFRSVLFGLFVRLRGEVVAVVATALLFGLWHVVPAWETADGAAASVAAAVAGTVAVTTAAGILFALLRRWSRSVVAPFLAHWATNSLAYLAALVSMDLLG